MNTKKTTWKNVLLYSTAVALNYIFAAPVEYKQAKRIDEVVTATEDLKPKNRTDIAQENLAVIVRDDSDSSWYNNPTERLKDMEQSRIVAAFARGDHNDLPLDAKETIGLFKTASRALWDTVWKQNMLAKPYGGIAKDRWLLYGSN